MAAIHRLPIRLHKILHAEVFSSAARLKRGDDYASHPQRQAVQRIKTQRQRVATLISRETSRENHNEPLADAHCRVIAAGGGQIMINHNMLRAAQNKALIARFIGDGLMWMSAYNDMKAAIGFPWHRK